MSVDPQNLRYTVPHVRSARVRRIPPAKRAFDIVVAGTGLVALSPLLALIAIAILIESRRPVLYRQKRHGLGREVFSIWKFRTLGVTDGDGVFRQVQSPDDGVTRVGRFLRRFNLDELPQLWNVVAGEMSLVGPRPHPVAMDAYYEDRIINYAGRYAVRPGMTGWAQVNSLRGPTVTLGSMQARVNHDLYYIDHQSFWFDLRILARTLFTAAAFRNAF